MKPKRLVPLERYTVMSQREVGVKLGISAMRVCQIEKRALEKIKHGLQAQTGAKIIAY